MDDKSGLKQRVIELEQQIKEINELVECVYAILFGPYQTGIITGVLTQDSVDGVISRSQDKARKVIALLERMRDNLDPAERYRVRRP